MVTFIDFKPPYAGFRFGGSGVKIVGDQDDQGDQKNVSFVLIALKL